MNDMARANCRGCEYEYEYACELVRKGHHIATTVDREFIDRKHLCIIIVDDCGEIILE
jgi:hypothetical protein